jgi:hypothetical protein
MYIIDDPLTAGVDRTTTVVLSDLLSAMSAEDETVTDTEYCLPTVVNSPISFAEDVVLIGNIYIY